MDAEILNIGTEVTTGRVVNSNAAFLGQRLSALGLRVGFHTVVPDDRALMMRALETAHKRSSLIFVTGGLGPTSDDLTTELMSSLFRKVLVRDRHATTHLLHYLQKRVRPLTVDALKMTRLPKGATPLVNRVGMAPGYYVRHQSRHYFVLPGVPHELREMFTGEVEPLLLRRILPRKGRLHFQRKSLGVFGLPEAQIGQAVTSLNLRQCVPALGGELSIGFQVAVDEARIVLEVFSKKPREIITQGLELCEQLIRARLGQAVFTAEEKSLSQVVHETLLEESRTLALAESCTGGLLGAALTDHPGSSNYFLGGVISYSNASKVRELGVAEDLLQQHGAVSEACARAMAEGAVKRFGAEIGLAITGIAGPQGGSDEKPVGTVFMALSAGRESRGWHHCFGGDRARVRSLSVAQALNLLRIFLGSTGGMRI